MAARSRQSSMSTVPAAAVAHQPLAGAVPEQAVRAVVALAAQAAGDRYGTALELLRLMAAAGRVAAQVPRAAEVVPEVVPLPPVERVQIAVGSPDPRWPADGTCSPAVSG